MQMCAEPDLVPVLTDEIEEYFHTDEKLFDREKASRRVRLIISGIARKLHVDGEVKMFGSFSNGFKTGGSDLDVVFVGNVGQDNIVSLLGKFAALVPDYGFENVTKIFSANVPLVKFTDKKAGMEVDFCINNELGVRNSLLLKTYTAYDDRVLQLGRLVKDWAKKNELVGTADGYLNSYAYMLLTIHYLQSLTPPVVPNLQELCSTPHPVNDNKWGCDDRWETKFLEDTSSLPPSENTMTIGELLIGFFQFYTCQFDWHAHAVCMRLNRPGVAIPKYSLLGASTEEQWVVEDPFDLKHNLAGKCTRAGRQRILEEMRESMNILTQTGSWTKACPSGKFDVFFLKCRVSQGVTPQALLEGFEGLGLVKLHFPKPDVSGRMAQAFLEFSSAADRRRAHTRNETYVADCQLQLHYSSQHGLQEAVSSGQFSTYEMTSYQMQKRVISSRVHSLPMMMPSRGPPDALRGHAPFPEGPMMGQGPPPPPPPPPMLQDGNPYNNIFPGAPFGGPPHRGQMVPTPPNAVSPGSWDPRATAKLPMDAGQMQKRMNAYYQDAAAAAAVQMAKTSTTSVKGAVKASNANSTKASSAKANSATAKAQAREEQKTKAAASSKKETAIQDHQYPAQAQVTVLQRDTGVPKSIQPSQVDRLGTQLPAKSTQPPRTSAASASANTAQQGGWLTVPIGSVNSDSSESPFGENQETELTGLLKFLARHHVDIKGAREVALQIEISNDDSNAPTPLFSQQTFDDLQSIQIWSKSLSL